MFLVVNGEDGVPDLAALVEEPGDELLPGLEGGLLFGPERLHLVLDLQVGLVWLLHVLIHALQSLFILLDAIGHLSFHLGKLFKNTRVLHLAGGLLPHSKLAFLLDVKQLRLFVPLVLQVKGLYEHVLEVIHFNASKDLLHISCLDTIASLLEDFQCLHQIFVAFSSISQFLLAISALLQCLLILPIDRVNCDFSFLQQTLKLSSIPLQILDFLIFEPNFQCHLAQVHARVLRLVVFTHLRDGV